MVNRSFKVSFMTYALVFCLEPTTTYFIIGDETDKHFVTGRTDWMWFGRTGMGQEKWMLGRVSVMNLSANIIQLIYFD